MSTTELFDPSVYSENQLAEIQKILTKEFDKRFREKEFKENQLLASEDFIQLQKDYKESIRETTEISCDLNVKGTCIFTLVFKNDKNIVEAYLDSFVYVNGETVDSRIRLEDIFIEQKPIADLINASSESIRKKIGEKRIINRVEELAQKFDLKEEDVFDLLNYNNQF